MKTIKKNTVKVAMNDILLAVKWSHISTRYFGKSRSWFSQRLNGYDGNNLGNDFTDKEKTILKESLYDLSERIKICADRL